MPLHDHFHGELAEHPSWEAVHTRWAVAIADDLNRRLPNRFVAEAPMDLGSRVSADVAEYERPNGHGTNGKESLHTTANGGGVGVATLPVTEPTTELETYAPPETDLAMPAAFPTEIKIEVRDRDAAYKLLAVVELVSPSNKKEAGEREQFAAKCLSYLGKGIGLVVIDIVTERHWNLHNELIRLAEREDKFLMPDDAWLYITAYRPVHRNKKDLIDLWLWSLKVGESLPAVPLALKGYGCVKLDLEATYTEACLRLRIS
jgi:hypothetical protein